MGITLRLRPVDRAAPVPDGVDGFRMWRPWIIVVGVVAIVMGWGLAIYNLEISRGNTQSVATLRSANTELNSQLDEITRQRDLLRDGQADAKTAAQKLENAAAAHETDVKKREDAVKLREDDVKKREDDVQGREDAVTGQEKVKAENSIDEGTWSVGVDVQPGTYRAKDTVSDFCYWEITSDANGDHIVANDIVSGGRPTVTLKKGQFFKTHDCGTWAKV